MQPLNDDEPRTAHPIATNAKTKSTARRIRLFVSFFSIPKSPFYKICRCQVVTIAELQFGDIERTMLSPDREVKPRSDADAFGAQRCHGGSMASSLPSFQAALARVDGAAQAGARFLRTICVIFAHVRPNCAFGNPQFLRCLPLAHAAIDERLRRLLPVVRITVSLLTTVICASSSARAILSLSMIMPVDSARRSQTLGVNVAKGFLLAASTLFATLGLRRLPRFRRRNLYRPGRLVDRIHFL
jgi:hypothetical protein